MEGRSREYAIRFYSYMLSTFGSGPDFVIYSANDGKKSKCNLGNTYEIPQGYNKE